MLNRKEFLWSEQYRPITIEECILPERMKKPFLKYREKGNIPNLLLTGSPGVGKTTLAFALCKELGLQYLLIQASKDSGIETVRSDIYNFASTMSMNGKQKVIILDEVDGMSPNAYDALRPAMQQFSSNCSFILTGNFKDRIPKPIQSRCTLIDFRLKKEEYAEIAKQFHSRIMNILDKEEVSYDKKVVAKIIEKYFPDFRRTINEIQHVANNSDDGGINADALSLIAEVHNLSELVQFLKDKNFKSMRKWVTENASVDSSSVYRKIYDSLSRTLTGDSIPAAVIILAKYQYQEAFVADSEINMVACLTELMVDCDFK